MDLVILGVIKAQSFSLSNYRLSIQLLVVNLFIIFFGLIFLIFFNYYLITNDKLINKKITLSVDELKKITSYLERNSIINIPLYQTNYICRVIDKDIDSELYNEQKCEQQNLFINTLELSEYKELERYVIEQHIYQNYSDRDFNIKIFNDNWIEIADSDDPYLSMIVNESEILDKKPEKTNIFDVYQGSYFNFFNYIYSYILHNKFAAVTDKKTHDINIVSETIRKKIGIQKRYIDKDNKIINVLSSPLMLDGKVYGVALLSLKLITKNDDLAQNSINLLNFFIVLVLIIIILSFFFLRGLIIPLNQLTKITVLERDKIKNTKKNRLSYKV